MIIAIGSRAAVILAQDFGIKKDQKDPVIGSVLLKKNGANFTSKNGRQIIEEMGELL